MEMKCSPVRCKIYRCSLITRREKALASRLGTHGVFAVEVLEDDMVEHHACVDCRFRAVGILETGLHEGDGAVLAR